MFNEHQECLAKSRKRRSEPTPAARLTSRSPKGVSGNMKTWILSLLTEF